MAHDVFVSHSSKDKPTADAVCAMLESQGIRCWVAPRDITPGMDWGEAIVHAVKGARVMVLVFSASANESPQIKREVERAVNKGIPVIPLRIEDVAPTASLEYFISTPHWLDAFTPPLEGHLRYLAQIIQQIIGAQRTTDAVGPTAAPPSGSCATAEIPTQNQAQSAKTKPRHAAPLIGLFAAAAALLAILSTGWWFGIERPRREESRRQIEAERISRTKAELETARMAEEQSKLRAEMEAAKRAEEKRQAAEAVARFDEEKRQREDAARIAMEKQRAEEAAKLAEEKRIAEARAAEAAKLAAAKKEPDVAPIKTGLAENQNGIQNVRNASAPEPSATKKPETVFELVKEANRSLGEDSKDRLFYARSEAIVGQVTPIEWRLGFYDPQAKLKVVELKFVAGAKVSSSRPFALIEMYGPEDVLDRKKLIVDSNEALRIATNNPALATATFRRSQIKLEAMGTLPVWKINLWAAPYRNSRGEVHLGELFIAAEDGKIVKNDLYPERMR